MLTVKQFSSEYRDGVRKVCIDTAYFGRPLDEWIDIHPELYADFYTRYYTDFEPDGLFIALVNNKIIGYMALCSDLKRQTEVLINRIVPDIIKDIISGKYSLGCKIIWMSFRMLADRLRYGPLNLSPKGYNADIHINFLPGYRGIYRAWGKMVNMGYKYLMEKDTRYIIGVLFQNWEDPEEKMNLLGFKTFQKRKTTIKGKNGWFLITGCDLKEWQERLPKAIAIFTRKKAMNIKKED
jgi:hypothetical protein